MAKLPQTKRGQQFYIQNICFDEQACFIVTSNPIQLYFITQNSKEIIQIILQKQLKLIQSDFFFKDNFLFIYGHDQQKFNNYVYTINLMTLQVKQICQGKKYSPGGRVNFISIFCEDRLYVFGGDQKKMNKGDDLLWTFDFQKGYWFALQIKSDLLTVFSENDGQKTISRVNYMKKIYQPGKCILKRDNQYYMVQLYQSRCSLMIRQGQNLETNPQIESKSLKKQFSFVLNKQVITVNQNGQIIKKMVIIVEKQQKKRMNKKIKQKQQKMQKIEEEKIEENKKTIIEINNQTK